jgi:hypothetical protein
MKPVVLMGARRKMRKLSTLVMENAILYDFKGGLGWTLEAVEEAACV